MARGDVTVFDDFTERLGEEVNLETDVFKFALITASTTPTAADVAPCFGTGGTTNLSTNQVTAGGNYAAGGPDINATYTRTSNVCKFTGDNISIAQNASNPTNARWGILYDDTTTPKRAAAFVDLGGTVDLTAGPFTCNWNAAGIFTVTRS